MSHGSNASVVIDDIIDMFDVAQNNSSQIERNCLFRFITLCQLCPSSKVGPKCIISSPMVNGRAYVVLVGGGAKVRGSRVTCRKLRAEYIVCLPGVSA